MVQVQGSENLLSECETKTIAAESYLIWVHLHVFIVEMINRFIYDEKYLFVTIKVHYLSHTHNEKDETDTIIDETIRINRGTRALSRTFMLKSGKLSAYWNHLRSDKSPCCASVAKSTKEPKSAKCFN